MVRSLLLILVILSPALYMAWLSATGYDTLATTAFAVLLTVPCVLVWLLVEIAFHSKGLPRARIVRQSFYALLVSLWSIAPTHWPLRLSFAIWKGQLEEARVALESGHPQTTPRWIGPFHVQRTEMYCDQFPALVVGGDPGGPIRLIHTQQDEIGNVWSELRLDRDWILNSED